MGKYLPDPEIDRLVQEMNRLVTPLARMPI
jgi:hypothetical protein